MFPFANIKSMSPSPSNQLEGGEPLLADYAQFQSAPRSLLNLPPAEGK